MENGSGIKIPEPGDFRLLLVDNFMFYMVTHDYEVVFKNKDYIRILRTRPYFLEKGDSWDTPEDDSEFKYLLTKLCACHTRKSMKQSININIAINGWNAYFLLHYNGKQNDKGKIKSWFCFM